MSISNELQSLYTKNIPETSTGSRRRLDFPTAIALRAILLSSYVFWTFLNIEIL